jgi:hypothetical protein
VRGLAVHAAARIGQLADAGEVLSPPPPSTCCSPRAFGSRNAARMSSRASVAAGRFIGLSARGVVRLGLVPSQARRIDQLWVSDGVGCQVAVDEDWDCAPVAQRIRAADFGRSAGDALWHRASAGSVSRRVICSLSSQWLVRFRVPRLRFLIRVATHGRSPTRPEESCRARDGPTARGLRSPTDVHCLRA